MGFRVTDIFEDEKRRMMGRRAKEEKAAIYVQHWYRSFQVYKDHMKRKEKRQARLEVAAVMIQSKFRMYLVKKRVYFIRRAWSHFIPIFRLRLLDIWNRRAIRYYTRRKTKEVLDHLVKLAGWTRRKRRLKEANIKAQELWVRNTIRKLMRAWRDFTDDEILETIQTEIANQHFYQKMEPVLFFHWREKSRRRRTRRMLNINIFLQCVDASAWNSSYQRRQVQLAQDYRHIILVAPVWAAFKRFLAQQTPMKARRAMARTLYAKNFLNHFVRLVFLEMVDYAHYRLEKKRNVAIAEDHWLTTVKAAALMKFFIAGKIHKFQKQRRRKKLYYYFIRFAQNSDYRTRKKEWMAQAAERVHTFRLALWRTRFLKCMDVNFWNRKMYRELVQRARVHYQEKISQKVFNAWRDVQEIVRKRIAMVDQMGDDRLLRRIFNKMVENLREEIEDRLDREETEREAERIAQERQIQYEREMKAATQIQAIWRGYAARKETIRWRSFCDWAILKVQQQVRVWKARRMTKKLRKYRDLQRVLMEEREEEQMCLEDELSYQLRRYYQSVSTLNRVFRGFRGRLKAFRRKKELIQSRNFHLNVTAKERALENMQKLRVEREEHERRKTRAARAIQVRFRGFLARVLVQEMRYRKQLTDSSIKMQSVYRRVLAVRKAAARRRHLYNVKMTNAVRKTQGKILRMLRFSNRYSQRRFTDFLGRMGLDPRHYQLSVRGQIREIKDDYVLAVKEMQLEMAVWKHARFDAFERKQYREAHKEEYLPPVVISNRDAVRCVLRCK